MSHSEQTLHYGLPKYIGTDIINPLTDFNDANDAIDEALYDANSVAAHAETVAQSAVDEVGSYDERITQAQDYATEALTKVDNTMDMMADEFDPLKQGGYAIGDIVIYQQKLYTFINPHTGAWDAGDVVQQPIGDAVKATIEKGKSDIAEETAEALAEIAGQTQKVTATQAMIAPPFDSEKIGGYAAGDTVTYADKLYQFTSAHVGAWTGLDVNEVSVVGQFGNIIGKCMVSNTIIETTASMKIVPAHKYIFERLRSLWVNKAADVDDIILDSIIGIPCNISVKTLGGLANTIFDSPVGYATPARYAGTTDAGGGSCDQFRVDMNNGVATVTYSRSTWMVGSGAGQTYGSFTDVDDSPAEAYPFSYHYVYTV